MAGSLFSVGEPCRRRPRPSRREWSGGRVVSCERTFAGPCRGSWVARGLGRRRRAVDPIEWRQPLDTTLFGTPSGPILSARALDETHKGVGTRRRAERTSGCPPHPCSRHIVHLSHRPHHPCQTSDPCARRPLAFHEIYQKCERSFDCTKR